MKNLLLLALLVIASAKPALANDGHRGDNIGAGIVGGIIGGIIGGAIVEHGNRHGGVYYPPPAPPPPPPPEAVCWAQNVYGQNFRAFAMTIRDARFYAIDSCYRSTPRYYARSCRITGCRYSDGW